MKIVTVFRKELAKSLIIRSSIIFEDLLANPRHINAPRGFLVAQTFARQSMVGAKPGIRLDRGSVRVKGKNIR